VIDQYEQIIFVKFTFWHYRITVNIGCE
jgi:hypothetical protein